MEPHYFYRSHKTIFALLPSAFRLTESGDVSIRAVYPAKTFSQSVKQTLAELDSRRIAGFIIYPPTESELF